METKEKENILPDTEGMSGENNISGGKNIKKKLSKKTRITLFVFINYLLNIAVWDFRKQISQIIRNS